MYQSKIKKKSGSMNLSIRLRTEGENLKVIPHNGEITGMRCSSCALGLLFGRGEM
jgi:hypothetical protein